MINPSRIFIALATVSLVAICLSPANALPSFARREGGVSCSMCHWYPNALNATGKAYLRRGLRTKGEEANAAKSEFKLGNYVSMVLAPESTNADGGNSEFSAGSLALWPAGPVDNKFSILTDIEFNLDEETTETGEAYLQYVSNTGDNYISVRAGQFQTMALLTSVGGAPSIALSIPVALRTPVGDSYMLAPWDTPFTLADTLHGVELGIVKGKFSGYIGLGNGPGQNIEDNHMDLSLSAEYEIGDMGSSVGVFSFDGKDTIDQMSDSFTRSGIIGNFTGEKTRLVSGYIFGHNSDEFSSTKFDNHSWFAEVDHKAGKDSLVYARWDDFAADLAEGGRTTIHGPVLGVSFMPSQLTRLSVEAGWPRTDGFTTRTFSVVLQLAL